MKKIHENTLREKAKRLRIAGISYGKISKKIKVPKSTLSMWLKNTPLSPEDKHRLYTKQVQMITYGKYCQKIRRQNEVEKIILKAREDFPLELSNESYVFIGTALYWAEGTKKGLFEITNSDPKLVLFMVEWIKKVFKISPNRIRARLNIHKDQNEQKIIRFWSRLCGIPKKNFGRSFIKPPNKNYKKNILYFGTIKISIQKSTDLKYKVLGWLELLLPSITKKVELMGKRFKSNRL